MKIIFNTQPSFPRRRESIFNFQRLLIAICFLIICLPATKAQIYHLSLDESIEIAKKQSFEIQNLLQDKIIAENDLKAATASLRTSVYMSFVLPEYTENVEQWQDSLGGITFFPLKTLRGSGNLFIRQPLPTDGTITVSSGILSNNDYYNDRRSSRLNTSITFRQPLNSFWGYNAIRSDLKRARLNFEQADKSLKRAELNIVYAVSSSFYNLLSVQKQQEIAQMNLERQTEAYEISKNKYEAGLIREVENLQMEVDLAEAQNTYDMTEVGLKSSTNSFIKMIGLELDAVVTLKSEMENYSIVHVDPAKAVDYAIRNRLEIREREIQIEIQKLRVSQQKSAGRPQADLVASWNKIGVSNIPIDQSYSNSMSSSWDDLVDRPANYQVGLQINIPIIDWGRNKRLVKSAEAKLKQNVLGKEDEQRGIEVEVRNLVANLQTALKRLQQLEKNVSVAERSYGITLQRYTDGDIDSQALALERNRLNTAQQSHLRAYIEYRLQLADLMRKTFYDFENDIPIE